MKQLTIGNKTFTNRFFLGTGKFASSEQTKAALAASETELVTVALTRVHEGDSSGDDILKAIDKAGFDPAARAAHRLAALRDPGWTDPDVANVAKGLAGDKTLKNAARLFAQALTGDAAQALDDHEMRDVFITFGKAFVLTLKTLFKPQLSTWAVSFSLILHFIQC